MPKAVPLRSDYSAHELRRLARESDDANQTRRLLALAGVADGLRRDEAAQIADVDARTLRDWVVAFNEKGPVSQYNTPPPGRPPKLSPEQKQELADLVETEPDFEIHGVVRWRRSDLKRIIHERYGVSLNEASVGRLLRELKFSHVSARPQHPKQDRQAIEDFKKKTYPSE